jgi:hypothetical protein
VTPTQPPSVLELDQTVAIRLVYYCTVLYLNLIKLWRSDLLLLSGSSVRGPNHQMCLVSDPPITHHQDGPYPSSRKIAAQRAGRYHHRGPIQPTRFHHQPRTFHVSHCLSPFLSPSLSCQRRPPTQRQGVKHTPTAFLTRSSFRRPHFVDLESIPRAHPESRYGNISALAATSTLDLMRHSIGFQGNDLFGTSSGESVGLYGSRVWFVSSLCRA